MTNNVSVESLDVGNRDRFILIYDDVWHALKGDSACFVYMCLKRRVNPDNKQWHGTYKKLAIEAGVSESTFRRGIETLEELGLVVSKQRFVPKGWNGKDQSKISYKGRDKEHPIQIGNLFQIRFHMPVQNGGGSQNEQTPPPQNEQTPPPQNEHQTEDTKDIETRDIETSGSSGDDQDSSQDSFDLFWDVYPRKIGDKQSVKAKFRELEKEVGTDPLITGARNYATECAQSNTKTRYICYPSTFLNQNRWKDLQVAPSPKSSSRPSMDVIKSWKATPTVEQERDSDYQPF